MKSMLTPRWSGPPGVQVRALSDRLRSTAGRWTVAEPSRLKFFEPRGRMTDPRLASLADFLLSPGKRKRNSSPEAAAEAAEGRPAEAAEGSCPAELRPRFADVLLTMEIDDAVADQEFATRHAASIAVAVAEAQRAAAVAAEAFHRVLLFSAAGEPDSGRGTADDERREGVTLPLADGDQDDAILAPGGAPRQTPGCCPVEGAAVEAEATGGRPLELRPSCAAALETRAQEEAKAAAVVVVVEEGDDLAEHGIAVQDSLVTLDHQIDVAEAIERRRRADAAEAEAIELRRRAAAAEAEAIERRRRAAAAEAEAEAASGRPALEVEGEPRPIDVSSHAGQEVQGARASPPTPTMKNYRFFEVSWAVLGDHCGSPAAPRGHCFGGARFGGHLWREFARGLSSWGPPGPSRALLGYIGALCGRVRAFLGAPGEGKDEGLLRWRIVNCVPDSSQSESESDPEPESDSQDTLQEQRAEQVLESLNDRVIYHSRLAASLNGEVRFHDEVFYSINARVSQLDRPSINELRCLDLLIVGGDEPKFYVGGTQNPTRRWQGDPNARNGRPMPGHCLKWQEMHVVAARVGSAGPSVESALISYSMQRYNERCVNKKADSRGLSGKEYVLNFIYVCVKARAENI